MNRERAPNIHEGVRRSLFVLVALAPVTAAARETLPGAMIPAPSAIGLRAPADPLRAPTPLTVYLAFDGPTIGYAEVDDSRQNLSYIDRAAVAYAPYGDDAAQAALVQAVRSDWAPYAAAITETRPAAGDYVMTVVSPTNPYAGEAAGIAPLDCDDAWTPNNVVFAFHGPGDGYSIAEQARTIGQEVAHSIGLEHTTFDEDILSYAYGPVDFWFADTCSPILTTPASPEIYCRDQHLLHCPDGAQNSHAELLALLGEGAPDTDAPSVRIVAPRDGAVFDEGEPLAIVVEALDTFGVVEVQLLSDGEVMASDASSPWGWPVDDIAPGTYGFWVEARDGAGNVAASPAVSIEVRAAGQGDAGDEAGDDADDLPDGSEGSSGGGGEGEGDDDDAPMGHDDGEDDDDRPSLPRGFGEGAAPPSACTIATHEGGGGLGWLAALVVLAGRRGRQSRISKTYS